jgi:hypothetical protein
MIRRSICSLSAAALIVAVAVPVMADQPTGLDAAFGATIVSTYPDGRTARLWLHKDGSYSARGRRGDPSGGRWTQKGDKLCLKQRRPFPVPFSFCTPMVEGGVGTTWSAKAVTGEPVTVKLIPGEG